MKKMKKQFIVIVLTGILGNFSSICFSQFVHFVSTADSSTVKVFEVSQVAAADLKVFLAGSEAEVNKIGIWFNKPNAQHKVFTTNVEGDADVKIFYVSTAAEAGWVSDDRIKIFEPKR